MINTSNEIVSNSQSNRTTPTAVSFKGKFFLGENTGNLLISNYQYSFINFKKIMNLYLNESSKENNETHNNNLLERNNNTILFKIKNDESISF